MNKYIFIQYTVNISFKTTRPHHIGQCIGLVFARETQPILAKL